MLHAKLIGRIALFTCENIVRIEFYLQGLSPKILAMDTIKYFIDTPLVGLFSDNATNKDIPIRTRTTTWNLPGPSGTRDCINIVSLSHPSPLFCGG